MLMAFAGCCACSPSAFACEDDSGCAGAQAGGFCEPSGFCSFPDDGCPSGRRYGEYSGQGLGDLCVDPPEGTSTGATSQAGPASTSLTTSLATSTTVSDETGSTGSGGADTTSSPTTQGSSTDGVCREGWWDCAWTVRQSVTLHGMPLDSPVAALPFSARIDPALLEDETLVFVDEGGALIPWEPDGALAWLSVDVNPGADTRVWAYGGNPSGASPEVAESVWDDSFVAVWHLSDGSDASDSNNDAVPTGVVPEDGRFDSATRFDGVDDHLEVPATGSLADLRGTGLTADLWLRPELAAGTTYKRIFDKTDSTTATTGWAILLSQTMPLGQIQVDLGYELAEGQAMSADFDVSDWVHLVVTIAADDTVGFWVNGATTASTQTPGDGTIISDADQPGSIGSLLGDAPSDRFYDGLLDELRISRGVRSEAWIVGTYTSGLPDAVTLGRLEDLQDE